VQISRRRKIVFAATAVFVALWAYLAIVSLPLGRELRAAKAAAAEAEQITSGTARELAALREREVRMAEEEPQFAWAKHLLSTVLRPYLVETPLKFSKSFRQQGLGEAHIELVQLLPFPTLAEYAIAKWEIRLPQSGALPFGEALAAVENAIPLGELKSLAIQRHAGKGGAEIMLNFDTLVQP
jgi:hypothetical protein